VSYLLDTNVLSELRRKQPDKNVVQWFSRRPVSTLYLSVLSLGEIRKGVESLFDVVRRQALLDWLETELPSFFAGRILSIDAAVAQAGRPLPAIDSLLVATATQYGFVLVTRNLRDMRGLGVQVVSPWDL
jgi:toxin FitB